MPLLALTQSHLVPVLSQVLYFYWFMLLFLYCCAWLVILLTITLFIFN
jgi:hypothetical protein